MVGRVQCRVHLHPVWLYPVIEGSQRVKLDGVLAELGLKSSSRVRLARVKRDLRKNTHFITVQAGIKGILEIDPIEVTCKLLEPKVG